MLVDKFFTHQRSCRARIDECFLQAIWVQVFSNCSRFGCHLCSRLLTPQGVTKDEHGLPIHLSPTSPRQHPNRDCPAFSHVFLPLCLQNWLPSCLSRLCSSLYCRSYWGGKLCRSGSFFPPSPGFPCFRPFLPFSLPSCHESLHLNFIVILLITPLGNLLHIAFIR